MEDDEVRAAMKAAMIASTHIVSKSTDKRSLGRARAISQSVDAHAREREDGTTSPSVQARKGPGFGLGSNFQIDDNDEVRCYGT